MLEQLMKLVEQNAGDAIIKNKAIPDQHNNAAIQTVAQQIFSGLQSQASQGNLTQIAGLFQGSSKNVSSNPIVSQLISSVAGSVASKFGVSQQAAQSMASSLLPTVMNQLVKKTNDPNDNSFDLTNIMKGVSGNSNLDVASIMSQVTGSGNKSPLGGLGNVLGGLFGKK
jgi:uncharacterized protein YidB (DUF937 family)